MEDDENEEDIVQDITLFTGAYLGDTYGDDDDDTDNDDDRAQAQVITTTAATAVKTSKLSHIEQSSSDSDETNSYKDMIVEIKPFNRYGAGADADTGAPTTAAAAAAGRDIKSFQAKNDSGTTDNSSDSTYREPLPNDPTKMSSRRTSTEKQCNHKSPRHKLSSSSPLCVDSNNNNTNNSNNTSFLTTNDIRAAMIHSGGCGVIDIDDGFGTCDEDESLTFAETRTYEGDTTLEDTLTFDDGANRDDATYLSYLNWMKGGMNVDDYHQYYEHDTIHKQRRRSVSVFPTSEFTKLIGACVAVPAACGLLCMEKMIETGLCSDDEGTANNNNNDNNKTGSNHKQHLPPLSSIFTKAIRSCSNITSCNNDNTVVNDVILTFPADDDDTDDAADAGDDNKNGIKKYTTEADFDGADEYLPTPTMKIRRRRLHRRRRRNKKTNSSTVDHNSYNDDYDFINHNQHQHKIHHIGIDVIKNSNSIDGPNISSFVPIVPRTNMTPSSPSVLK